MECQGLKIGFIGGGNMAQALANCFIKRGNFSGKDIWVSSRTQKTLDKWIPHGVNTTLKNGEIVENSDIIFIAVKPQALDTMLNDTAKTLTKALSSKLFISILVGVPLNILETKLSCISSNPRLVRCLPNTPVSVGEGIIVYCYKNTTPEDESYVEKIFSWTGITEIVPESLMNAFSALCGSTPAFAYLMIEALSDGAVKMGIPRALATKFASQALIGAGKMVLQTEKHPGQLKDEVCSPGGTTICGVHEMEKGSVRGTLISAIEATVNKASSMDNSKK